MTGPERFADELMEYDALATAYTKQIEHTDLVRAEYQKRVADLSARLSASEQAVEVIRADAERFAWLDKQLCGADFEHELARGRGGVLLIALPEGAKVCNDLRRVVDDAKVLP